MDETTKKERVSSILKQQKSRVLVPECDVSNSATDSPPTSRLSKRVSFKRVSFVKPFISGIDDKNTIWDNTYEEEVGHTDSTQETISQSDTKNTSDDFNTSIFVPNVEFGLPLLGSAPRINSAIGPTALHLDTKTFQVDKAGLPSALLVDKENINVLAFAQHSEIISTEQYKTNFGLKSHAVTLKSNFFELQESEHHISKKYLEEVTNIQTFPYDADLNEVSMDLSLDVDSSTVGLGNIQISHTNKLDSDDMELTCNIPPFGLKNHQMSKVSDIECIGDDNTKFLVSEDMEFTCSIPPTLVNECLTKQTDSMTVQKKAPEVPFSENQEANGKTLGSILKNRYIPENIDVEGINADNMELFDCRDMELTCKNVPSTEHLTSNENNEEVSMTEDMEFTCKVPTGMEFSEKTSSLAFNNINDIEEINNDSVKFPNPDAMEFTCQVPTTTLKHLQDPPVWCDTKIVDESMEFTCKLPQPERSLKRPFELAQSETFSISKKANISDHEDECMELTCQVPVAAVPASEEGGKILDEFLEFTCSMPKSNDSVGENSCKIESNTSINIVSNNLNTSDENDKLSDMSNPGIPAKNNSEFDKTVDVSNKENIPRELLKINQGIPDKNDPEVDRTLDIFHRENTPLELPEGDEENFQIETVRKSISEDRTITNLSRLSDPKFNMNFTNDMSMIASFHLNHKNMSPCTDETQKLINFSLGRPFRDLSSISSFRFNLTTNEQNKQPNESDVVGMIVHKKNCESQCDSMNIIVNDETSKDGSHLCSLKSDKEEKQKGRLPTYLFRASNSIHLIEINESDATINDNILHVSKPACSLSTGDAREDDISSMDKSDSQDDSNKKNCLDQGSASNCISDVKNASVQNSFGILDDVELDLTSEYDKIDLITEVCNKDRISQLLSEVRTGQFCFADVKFDDSLQKKLQHVNVDLINMKFNSFKLPTIEVPNFEGIYNSVMNESSDNSENYYNHTSSIAVSVPDVQLVQKSTSWIDKIKEMETRCSSYWKFRGVEDNKYLFSTLYGSLELSSQFTDEGVIHDLQINNNLSDEAEPLSKYVFKLLVDALNYRNLENTLGYRYDILSFLDYLYLTVQKMLDFMFTCDEMKIVMDPINIIKIKVRNVDLTMNWVICVNITDLKNVDPESVTLEIKSLPYERDEDYVEKLERVVRNLVANCSKGLDFLKSFKRELDDYIGVLYKRKNYAQKK